MFNLLKLGSIVNIMAPEKGQYWKGRVVKVTSECDKKYFFVEGIDSPGAAIATNYDVEFKEGEFWQIRP